VLPSSASIQIAIGTIGTEHSARSLGKGRGAMEPEAVTRSFLWLKRLSTSVRMADDLPNYQRAWHHAT
jgi:hypothetical protein